MESQVSYEVQVLVPAEDSMSGEAYWQPLRLQNEKTVTTNKAEAKASLLDWKQTLAEWKESGDSAEKHRDREIRLVRITKTVEVIDGETVDESPYATTQNGRCVASTDPGKVKGLKYKMEMQVCFPGGQWVDEIWVYFWSGLDNTAIPSICIEALAETYKASNTAYVHIATAGFDFENFYGDDGDLVAHSEVECPQCDSTDSIEWDYEGERKADDDYDWSHRCMECNAIFTVEDDGTHCQIDFFTPDETEVSNDTQENNHSPNPN